MNDLDNLKRDRFELLSAYLDGEVSAAERRQVEDWLDHDPGVQRLYGRLLRLRQGFQSLPVPQASQPVEKTVEQVFARLDQRRQPRQLFWGGAAIAALVVGAVSSLFAGNPVMQTAGTTPGSRINSSQGVIRSSPLQTPSSGALMIALDRPVIEIPKAPVSPTEDALQNIYDNSNDTIR